MIYSIRFFPLLEVQRHGVVVMKHHVPLIECVLALLLGNAIGHAQSQGQKALLQPTFGPSSSGGTVSRGGSDQYLLGEGLLSSYAVVVPPGTEAIETGTDAGPQATDTSRTIDTLQRQADQWGKEKALLDSALADAKLQLVQRQNEIDSLRSIPAGQTLRIDSLEMTNAMLQRSIGELKESLSRSVAQASMRYILVGTEDQLEQMGVIETKGGFLSKEVFLPTSNASERRFDSVDIHQGRIDVGAPIRALVPGRPDMSYTILGPENKVIQIHRPEVFWRMNHLIVVTEERRNSVFQR
jgi:hypothetical protein